MEHDVTLDERIIEAQVIYHTTPEYRAWESHVMAKKRAPFPHKHVRDYYHKLSGEGYGDPIRWKEAEAAHAAAHAAYQEAEAQAPAWEQESNRLLILAQDTLEWRTLVELRAEPFAPLSQ